MKSSLLALFVITLIVSPSSAEFTIIPLPYPENAFESKGMSTEQIRLHYHKHHQGYATKLTAMYNQQADTSTLEKVIQEHAPGTVQYNLAAQIINHNHFWESLSPTSGGVHSLPQVDEILYQHVIESFGSLEALEQEFTSKALSHFGSGWVWLVLEQATMNLKIVELHDGLTPITYGYVPLLACDVWEHAYYVDHKNDRAGYLKVFWNIVNWGKAAKAFND
eukprot:PhF_6_TR35117/c0_g1_i1/m.51195/K04564/SOD2; superoxide dismutase, Fe-Mn family